MKPGKSKDRTNLPKILSQLHKNQGSGPRGTPQLPRKGHLYLPQTGHHLCPSDPWKTKRSCSINLISQVIWTLRGLHKAQLSSSPAIRSIRKLEEFHTVLPNTEVRGDPRVHMNFVTGLKCPVKCSNALVSPQKEPLGTKRYLQQQGQGLQGLCVPGVTLTLQYPTFKPALGHLNTSRDGESTALQRSQTKPCSWCALSTFHF